MVKCKDCQKKGIKASMGQPAVLCSKRVEVELNYDMNTCGELYKGLSVLIPKIKIDGELVLRLIDMGSVITITAVVKELNES